MPQLSVIIPTHKRPEILRQCIEHLEKQTIASGIEVIVVSDGYDEHTEKVCEEKGGCSISVRFFHIEKAQQGVARNRGVQEAKSPYCLFIGDDMFLDPDACECHLKDQNSQTEMLNTKLAVLGYVTWDPAANITPVMKWLEKSGWQFGYPKISRYCHSAIPKKMQHLFTYTGNISVPTDVVRAIPFREDIRMYGWEDVEWGRRLADAGIRLFYEPNAKALHHHHINMEESLRRMETLGKSVVKLSHNEKSFDRLPRGLKRMGYHVASKLPTMAGRHRKAFLRGIRDSIKG
jgi:glycosyltransferase involved in cell wall biosynthesis